MKQSLLLLPLLLLLPAAAAAPSLAYFGAEHELTENGSAQARLTLSFDLPTETLDYRFPYRIENLSVAAKFPGARCVPADFATGTAISCSFRGMTAEANQVVLSYAIPEAVGRSGTAAVFAATYALPLRTENAFLIVKLPPGIFLASEVANQSYAPPEGKTLTDGRRISVYWDYSNVSAGTSLPFRVQFSLPSAEQPSDWLVPAIALLAILAVAVASSLTYRYTKRRAGSAVAAVLNPDERALVDLLRSKGGKSLQKQLVRETDFSKAKVSRLVNSLRSRGMVSVEAVSGRENRIVLTLGEAKPAEKAEEKRDQQHETKEAHERKGEARPLLRPSTPNDGPPEEE